MIKVRLNNAEIIKLSVFDFDGTLFKSPEKPKGYKGNWWIQKESLGPPNVPEKPGNKFWNTDVVNLALKEIADKNTYTILLTGRIDQFFEDRIKDLTRQKDLDFDYIKLNEFGRDTGEFKVEEIQNILKKHKKIKKIEMWEDEQEKIELYKEKFSQDYIFRINKIG